MARVYLSIGSNLGPRHENCLMAVELLESHGVHVSAASSMRETEPWGLPDQPMFINMAVEAEAALSPQDLLVALKAIESDMGRAADSERWGPRVIDLDILLYDTLVLNEPGLTIPHPHMHEREFVLVPLCEIAPDAYNPVLGLGAGELLRSLRAHL